MRVGFLRFSTATVILSLAFCVSQAYGQVGRAGGDQMTKMAEGMSSASIRLVDSTGKTIDVKAQLRLTATKLPPATAANGAPTNFEASTRHGTGRIEGVPPGEYILEVSAPGYISRQQNLTVLGPEDKTEAVIQLLPDNGSADSDVKLQQPNVPVLSPAMRKELDTVVSDMNSNKMPDASRHLKNLLKSAPDNPDAHFIAGYYAERSQNDAEARTEYEQAVKLFPAHFSAQLCLGRLLWEQDDAAAALPHAQAALAADPNSWRAHWLLAEVHLRSDGDAAQAKLLAQQALDLGKNSALRAEVTLAMAEAMSGDRKGARALLEEFLKDHPDNVDADRAKKFLSQLQ
jgi:Flp pilus assembly protein TadD